MPTTQINIEFGAMRPERALQRVQTRFPGASAQLRTSTYLDDQGVPQQTSVIVAVIPSTWLRFPLLDALYALCQRFGQDCAGVRYFNGTGELVGPRAAQWGAFNPEYFITYDDAIAQA